MAKEVRILLYNSYSPEIASDLDGCPAQCRLLFDPARLAQADVLVFHMPTLRGPITVPRTAGQRWVGWCLESEIYFPQLAVPLSWVNSI